MEKTAETTPHEAGGARALRSLRLSVSRGPDAGTRYDSRTSDAVAVGTSRDNDVTLRDPRTSRYHVEFVPCDGGVRVRDLGSTNGTWVHGVRILDAVVPADTPVSVGQNVLQVRDAEEPSVGESEPAHRLPGFVAESAAMRKVANRTAVLAATEVAVLIEGETGTGKEVVARALHAEGSRSEGPFVVVDCGSLPATLVASELFGHERGAFTGAERRRVGAFERARGGTLFLDEVGELPLALQPALLGVLERKAFRRLGGDSVIEADVRVVAATNRDLRAEANSGSFRPDLYFRLAVARVHLPALRDRPEDIAALVRHFVEEQTGSAADHRFGPGTMRALSTHHWGGNVRELRNVVEAALAIGEVELGSQSAPQTSAAETYDAGAMPTYRSAKAAAVREFEVTYLRVLIASCGDNASEAARRAKMDRPYLLSLLRRHGLR